MEQFDNQCKKVAIVTNNIHCERNVQFFSTIEKYFVLNGWRVVDDFDCDKIVFSGCGFTETMYNKVFNTINTLKSKNFLENDIVILGCLPKTHEIYLKEKFKGHVIAFHNEKELDKIIDATVPFMEVEHVNVFRRHFIENPNKNDEKFHIKISQGCLRECTFCVINKAKGYINSIPKEHILKQVKKAIKIGNTDLMLMGEDTFAYGIDRDTTIIELIKYIKLNEPRVNLNFGYLHMRWLIKYKDEIIELCRKGIISNLHIGMQHVNKEVLTMMGRRIDFKEAYNIICQIKREIPGFKLGADIMVGFPGETREHFEELIDFFEKDKCFNKVQHFGYSDVRGARSATFENKVPIEEILERWQKLDKVLGARAYSNELNENSIDDKTFKFTQYGDIFCCKGTFFADLEELNININEVSLAENNYMNDETEFDFK
jgi:MiaB/RimO family radical SAM methylthiotransferase